MRWPHSIVPLVLLFFIGWGVVLFALGVEEELVRGGRLLLLQTLSLLGGEEWLAPLVLQIVKEHTSSFSLLSRPSHDRPYFEIEVVFGGRKEKERFLASMAAFVAPFCPFGLWERRSGDDLYSLFWGDREWFRFFLREQPKHLVAIVIDDIGYDHSMAEKFLALPVKLNVAIFPHLPQAPSLARLAKAQGKEVLIHLPMEAVDPQENSGEYFLLRHDASESTARHMLEEALRRLPQARGFNNHKGSLATQNDQLMRWCALFLREKGLYFLDSLTTSRSSAYRVMRESGVPALQRDVFLDGEPSVGYVLARLYETCVLARKRGFAVAIGHPKEATYEALRQFIHEFPRDCELVFLSEIIDERGW
ncbi:MAG: divergent polysaccharide deacetylase family protein [Candidatus Caldatribacteriaceae bacterium]